MKQCKTLEKIINKCDSPIEVIFIDYIYNKLGKKWKIEPQVKIGNFRVDFMISRKDGKQIDKYTKALVIECNGKQFHSEVEKCRKDQLRANYLNLLGYRVFPFRGSLIYNDMEDITRFIRWYLNTDLKPDMSMSPSDVVRLDFWDGRKKFSFKDIVEEKLTSGF